MKKIYLILPVLAGIMFGSSGIFVRTLTENGINPTTLLFLRFSIAALILLLAILITDTSLFKVEKKDLGLFIVCAISIVGLNLCYNTSMNLVSLSLAAVLLSTAPIFVIFFAYFIFREKITNIKIICIILAMIGCILASGLLESNVSVSTIGILGGVGASVFWAVYMMASKKSIENGNHTYTILFYSLILISLILIPFTDFNQITYFIEQNIIGSTIFLILHSTISFALPYILLTLSLNHVESGPASILTSGSEPLAALFYGALVYSEIPSAGMFIGIIITILAIVILTEKS